MSFTLRSNSIQLTAEHSKLELRNKAVLLQKDQVSEEIERQKEQKLELEQKSFAMDQEFAKLKLKMEELRRAKRNPLLSIKGNYTPPLFLVPLKLRSEHQKTKIFNDSSLLLKLETIRNHSSV